MEIGRRSLVLGSLLLGAAGRRASPAAATTLANSPSDAAARGCATVPGAERVQYLHGTHPSLASGSRTDPGPPVHHVERTGDVAIERNVGVALRDGTRIYVDVFRNAVLSAGPQAVILSWSPYGKHSHLSPTVSHVPVEAHSPLAGVEAPDPAYWCQHGYVVVYADPRGTWHSEGDAQFLNRQEANDCYDLIEWLGVQPWCSGKVGMSGVSYLAMIQWKVAALRPPHLAAINPWEGASDIYREVSHHGGMLDTGAVASRNASINYSLTRSEDLETNFRLHPLLDWYWQDKVTDLGEIRVPAYVVAGWGDHGLHTRGTLEGFRKIGSADKWLEIHGQKKWIHYYRQESVEKQRQFFDRFLKELDTPISRWPRVILQVRERGSEGSFRPEREWPLQRARPLALYLDAGSDSMNPRAPGTSSAKRYASLAADGQACFDYAFTQRTEITGGIKLKLWVEATGTDDMDIFVALRKFDRANQEVHFVTQNVEENGFVALGWLRASHRELDASASSAFQPVHAHKRRIPLLRGRPTPVEIEIWPSSTLFEADERLQVMIKGSDIYTASQQRIPLHRDTVNTGDHVIHTGGAFDSHLLVPVIQ